MSVTKRCGGESSKGRIVPEANPSWCGRIVYWANRPWGESSMGRIDHGANRPAFERNVHGRNVLLPFRSMAAIFDFQHTQTSESILTSLSVLPNPQNLGITVGMSLLSGIKAMIKMFYMSFRFMAAFLNFGSNSCQPLLLLSVASLSG
jgi:hypothetical protein